MNRSSCREAVFHRVAVACDHGGLALKDVVVSSLEGLGIEALDLGTNSPDSVDYPDFAAAAAYRIADGTAEAAILICGTGIGIAMSANKVAGIRAANCGDEYSASMARAHNDANALALGARVVGPGLAEALVERFCTTPFEGGRHARRVEKMMELETRGVEE